MPGDIAPPDKAPFDKTSVNDYCLYVLPSNGGIHTLRLDTPPKHKGFDDIEHALEYLQLQTSMRGSIGWVSLDHGQSWTGYTGDALDVVGLVKGFG
jgi:hypothetical protein